MSAWIVTGCSTGLGRHLAQVYRAAVEEGEEDIVAQQFATNFFGAVAMIKAALPMLASSVAEHDPVLRQLRLADAAPLPVVTGVVAAEAVFGW